MGIDWQNIFYITTSFVMILTLIICIWLIWLFFMASKLIKNLTTKVNKWGNIIDDIRYFRKNIKLKGIRFLLKILGKEDQNEQQ